MENLMVLLVLFEKVALLAVPEVLELLDCSVLLLVSLENFDLEELLLEVLWG